MQQHDSDPERPSQDPRESRKQLGTTLAIDPPLGFNSDRIKGGGTIAPPVPKVCDVRARRVLGAMIRATPPESFRPWRTKRSLALIADLLADGIPEDELVDHVEGCAELIRRGIQEPQWWTVKNLFGPKTLDRWRADVQRMRVNDKKAADREAAETRRFDEELASPPPQVTDLALHKLTSAAEAAYRANRWTNEESDDDAKQA